MSNLPTSNLEDQANRERKQLRGSLFALRRRIQETGDPQEVIRRNFSLALAFAGISGLILGYGIASFFAHEPPDWLRCRGDLRTAGR